MHITQIEIAGMFEDEAEQSTRAHVAFYAQDRQVHIDCTVSERKGPTLAKRLISEAIRQMRRMPEFRGGRGELSFEPGLWTEEETALRA